MANEPPHEPSPDSVSADPAIEGGDAQNRQMRRSFWQSEWQWVALAWLGGGLIGGTFLSRAFALASTPETAAAAICGVFLIIAPAVTQLGTFGGANARVRTNARGSHERQSPTMPESQEWERHWNTVCLGIITVASAAVGAALFTADLAEFGTSYPAWGINSTGDAGIPERAYHRRTRDILQS